MPKEAQELRMQQVRESLRRLRGKNLFRGTELCILPQGIIRLQAEARRGELVDREVVIHLTVAEQDLWAEEVPGTRKFYLRDFAMNMDTFLESVLEVVRGKPYLQTNPKSADYRKPDNG